MLGKKSLEPGIIFAPYIIQTTTPIIIDGVDKVTIRKRKINKIFNLGLDIKEDIFSPNKSIKSRYSKRIINPNYYKSV